MNGRRRTFANAADRNTSHRFSQKPTGLELSAGKKKADDKKVINTAEYLTRVADRQRNQAVNKERGIRRTCTIGKRKMKVNP